MTLLEITEPIFQFTCRLNRIARHQSSTSVRSAERALSAAAKTGAPTVTKPGSSLTFEMARDEFMILFDEAVAKAASDVRLGYQFKKIELPLIFFVDSMIAESKLSFAEEWNQNRLAYQRDELAGDEKFFNLLDETTKETGDEASERLAFFYICIGIGFTGIYFKQPELLRRTMLGLAPRVRQWVENDPKAKVCPEAYEGVDSRNFVKPAGRRMAVLGLVFVAFSLAVVVAYVWIMRDAAHALNASFADVLQKDVSQFQSLSK